MRKLVLSMGVSLDGLVARPGRYGAGGWALPPEDAALTQGKLGRRSIRPVARRAAVATADLVCQLPTVFPSHHGGFLGPDSGYPGQPEAFARKLRVVLGDERDGR